MAATVLDIAARVRFHFADRELVGDLQAVSWEPTFNAQERLIAEINVDDTTFRAPLSDVVEIQPR